MLARPNRFHGHNALRYVYQHGRTVRGPLWAIKYALNERRPAFRAAVVVSKKVSKSAVTRNRIRRRLYNQLRRRQESIGRPYDIVVTVFGEEAGTMPADQLERQLDAQLRQAGLLGGSAPAKGQQDKAML